jgi:hypothetical protein
MIKTPDVNGNPQGPGKGTIQPGKYKVNDRIKATSIDDWATGNAGQYVIERIDDVQGSRSVWFYLKQKGDDKSNVIVTHQVVQVPRQYCNLEYALNVDRLIAVCTFLISVSALLVTVWSPVMIVQAVRGLIQTLLNIDVRLILCALVIYLYISKNSLPAKDKHT